MKNDIRIQAMETIIILINICTLNYRKKLYKQSIDNNTNQLNNEYIHVYSISSERLKQYFWRLEQLPYIDDISQGEYQNLFASFDKFSIIGRDSEKGLNKRRLCFKNSGRFCGCFTTRR
ncbi:unnamed protein product [Heterobilharzia americana]|nr:unnamed protein product [Heterobilharzia americana]